MPKDIYKLPSIVLLCIGLIDLVRGFMHTFLLTWSATNIAKLNLLANGADQLFLLGAFGISNILTGLIYLVISRKARTLSPYILMTIAIAYLLGLVGIKFDGVHAQAEFYGRYFMYVYLTVCVITFIIFWIQKQRQIANK